MRTALFLLIYLLAGYEVAIAQGQNNIWAFGNQGGFDFNSGAPVPFTSSIAANLGCASVADKNGNLLFYTNGLKIWNRNQNVMPNGNGLMNGTSFAFEYQNTVIVPCTSDTSRYYVFYVQEYDDAVYGGNYQPDDKLYYSVVDITLDNGLGDVVPGMKDIVVDSGFCTALTTIPGRNCNVWLVTHMRDTNVFRAYSINGSVGSPITSHTGSNHGSLAYRTSVMKAANNDSSIALTNFTINLQPQEAIASTVELYHFDTATGIVSNCRRIDLDTLFDLNNFTGVCFSPDNSRLYAVQMFSGVYQYNLNLPTTAAITASKYQVSPFTILKGDVSPGPDGKIYVGSFVLPATDIDRINNPNGLGAACNYVTSAFSLVNAQVMGTFPQRVNWPYKDSVVYSHDTILCKSKSITLHAPQGYNNYLWQDLSAADSFVVGQSGKYWVMSDQMCHFRTDSFHVTISTLHVDLGHDTAICNGNSIVLDAYNDNATYLWNDGSIDPTLTVNQTGIYSVHVTQGACNEDDEIHVRVKELPLVNLGPDTTLCTGQLFALDALARDSVSFVWQDGQTAPVYYVNTPGIYSVTATLEGCTAGDTVDVQYGPCECPVFVPDAFTPNGDGRNDVLHVLASCAVRNFNIRIFNRFGQCVYVGFNINEGWDGTFNGIPLDMGTYYYQMSLETIYERRVEKKGDITLVR